MKNRERIQAILLVITLIGAILSWNTYMLEKKGKEENILFIDTTSGRFHQYQTDTIYQNIEDTITTGWYDSKGTLHLGTAKKDGGLYYEHTTTGSQNVAIGYSTMRSISDTDNYNIAIGFDRMADTVRGNVCYIHSKQFWDSVNKIKKDGKRTNSRDKHRRRHHKSKVGL